MKKKIIILGIITILILPVFSQHTTGFTKKENPLEITYNNEVLETEEMVTIQFQTYGIPNGTSKQKELAYSIIEDLLEKMQSYVIINYEKPDSVEAQKLREEIIDIMINNDLLPNSIKAKDLILDNKYITKQLPITEFNKHHNTNGFEIIGLCNFATYGEGSQTPIIILPRVIPFLLLPIPRLLLRWTATDAVTTCGGLISGKGFIANGQQRGTALGFWGIGFNVFLPPIKKFGFIGYALSVSCNAEDFEYYPPNNKPIISNPNPLNNHEKVPLTLSELSFEISDLDNDQMNYKVTTNPYIGQGSGSLKNDGTYSVPISNLIPSTTYEWKVEVDDGEDTTTSTFFFNTVKENPMILNPLPSNYISVSTSLDKISFELYDPQNDPMDFSVQTMPYIGSKIGKNVNNGQISFPIGGLKPNTWYTWNVIVTDGTYETNKEFSFYTGDLGLLGYWSFDNKNDIFKDYSGYENHGINYGTSWIQCNDGDGALVFDGKNDYINIPDITDFEFIDQSITFSCWTQIVDNPNEYRRFISLRSISSNGYPSISLLKCRKGFNNGKIVLSIHGHNNEITMASSIQKGDQLPKNTWLFVTGVIEYPSAVKLYINGELQESVPAISYDLTEYEDIRLNFGKSATSPDLHKGMLDEIRIYNRALSENEIQTLYKGTLK